MGSNASRRERKKANRLQPGGKPRKTAARPQDDKPPPLSMSEQIRAGVRRGRSASRTDHVAYGRESRVLHLLASAEIEVSPHRLDT